MSPKAIAASYAFISIAYIALFHPNPSFMSAHLKMLPILLLAIATVLLAAPGWRWPVTTALLFSALGDLLLALDDLKGGLFIAGLGSFLMAQALYAWVFWRHRSPDAGRRWLALGYIPVGLLLAWLVLPAADALALPVAVYLVGISLMVTGAAMTDRPLLVFAGALCFAASDTLIAVNKFLVAVPAAGTLIMASYYLAQGLICAGVLRRTGTVTS